MVSFKQNICVNNIIHFVFFSLIINNWGKCYPQKNDAKNVKNQFDWNSRRPDFNVKVNKTWLKFDENTVKNNQKAEEAADPNDTEIIRRRVTSGLKRIDLSPSDCGQSENLRIVNGHDAPQHAYPWIVVIVRFGEPICAGNIINRYWVVTAGHCFMKNNSTKSLFLRIGTNLSDKGTRVKVANVFIHPRFNIDNMYNSDISLIKTAKALPINRNVRSICLPKHNYDEPTEKSLMVAGWGAKSFISTLLPIQLQETKLPIISAKRCISRYNSKRITIYKSQICTWAKGKDACRGDSGGPGVQYQNGRAYLIGLVSFGITCADKYPGIFTKLSYFLQWIQYTIQSNTKKKNTNKKKKTNKKKEITTTEAERDSGGNKNKKGFFGISLGGAFNGAIGGGIHISMRNKKNGSNIEQTQHETNEEHHD